MVRRIRLTEDVLKAYHKNPRQITHEQYGDLEKWLAQFGDLSGITHNLPTDETITGNQRCRVIDINECEIVIEHKYDEPDEQGTVGLGYVIWQGNRYNYRQVVWDERTAEQANVIANRAGGSWNFDILANEWQLDDLLEWGFEERDLQLDWGVPNFEPVDESEQPRLDQKAPITCPHCGKEFVPA